MSDVEKLQYYTKQLSLLLEKPEPGLMTWRAAVVSRVRELHAIIEGAKQRVN